MATIRVEFLNIQQSNSELFMGADNVISKRAAPSVEIAITSTPLSGAGLIPIPKCDLVRIIVEGSNGYVEWGADSGLVASQTSSVKFYDGQPEVIAPAKTGSSISAMTA